jgi:hypothetical protein
MKRLFKFILLIVLLTVFDGVVHAQPGSGGGGGPGSGGGGNPGGGGGTPVPITGIEVLLGLGGALGAKKLVGKLKKS